MPPVVTQPTKGSAVYVFGLLSATGTGIPLSALVGGLVAGYRVPQLVGQFFRTIWLVRFRC